MYAVKYLVIGYVDHHERQEAKQEAAKDDQHHAGQTQVLSALVLFRSLGLLLFTLLLLCVVVIGRWFVLVHHRKVLALPGFVAVIAVSANTGRAVSNST